MKIHVKAKRARIELIPLLDMIFLILVCFVYSFLSMSVNKGLDVKLPTATQAVELKSESIVVTVTENKLLYIDNEVVSQNAFITRLKKRVSENPALKVFINADRKVIYQDLINIIDRLKIAGIQKVSLQTVVKNE
ncbi:MAG: biopolymer transporter ExbD [Candidatus Omnitrophica bacterium]|nr:biopolymer transporter ExbD [Candidatus Omnitrophota bacterium]